MSSTQRNESLNNEIKGYISVKYDMLTFFEHFDRLLRDKRYEEVTSDFKATQSTPLELKVRCSCKKFEFAGILCSHALKIHA